MQYKKFLGKHSGFYSLRNKEAGVKETMRNHRHSVFVVNMLSFGIRVACDGDMKRKPVKKWLWEVLMVPCFYFALHATLQIARLRPALRILSMKPAPRKLNEIPESLKSSEIQLSLRPYPAIPHFFLLSVIFAFKLGSSCTCALSGHLEIDSFISFFFFFLPFERIAVGLALHFILGGSVSILQNAWVCVLSSYWFSAHVWYELPHRLLTWTHFWQRMQIPVMHSNTIAQIRYWRWFS